MRKQHSWIYAVFFDAVLFGLLWLASQGHDAALTALQFILWPMVVLMLVGIVAGWDKSIPLHSVAWRSFRLIVMVTVVLWLVLVGLPGLAAAVFAVSILGHASRLRSPA